MRRSFAAATSATLLTATLAGCNVFPQPERAVPTSNVISAELASRMQNDVAEAGNYWATTESLGRAALPSLVMLSGDATFLCQTVGPDGAPKTVPMGSLYPTFSYCRGQNTIVVPGQVANFVHDVGGDQALDYVLNHETGHWVQDKIGLNDVDSGSASSPHAHELGADCLAGVDMAASASSVELAAAGQGMARVLGGDTARHGTAQDQVAAFNAGSTTGDCSAYGIPTPIR